MDVTLARIHTARNRLDSTFERVASISMEDSELRSDGARYLCVLVSGFLETSVTALIIGYVSQVSHPRAAKLVEKHLRRTTNLKAEKLAQLIGSLDAQWENDLRDFMDDEAKAAIDSVVDLRHQIAHGGHTSVSYNTVRSYYKGVLSTVSFLESLLNPSQAQSAA